MCCRIYGSVEMVGKGSYYTAWTGKRLGHENADNRRSTRLQYLLVKRGNHLRLFTFTVFIADSDLFTLPAI